MQPDPGTPHPNHCSLDMNEDQPPPGAEPQRRGSSRNSIGLTNAPGDLQATWGPTQTHLLLTQNHSSPLQLQSQAEASPLPTLLPTRAVRGLRPPDTQNLPNWQWCGGWGGAGGHRASLVTAPGLVQQRPHRPPLPEGRWHSLFFISSAPQPAGTIPTQGFLPGTAVFRGVPFVATMWPVSSEKGSPSSRD